MRPIFLALAAFAAGCSPEPPAPPRPDVAALQLDWNAWVAARDTLFQSADSPLLPTDRTAFSGLAYFPYDTAFALVVRPAPELGSDTLLIPATGGERRPYVRYGTFGFEAGGRAHWLTAFKAAGPEGAGRLFVPFYDRTSGRETYGGGRYLDLSERADGTYVLDFNVAYHPYCVYNPAYSCPVPPPENRLDLAVTAGERLPKDS